MAETRTYTVPLRHGFWKTPRYRRTHVAVRVLRDFLRRHMKVEGDQLKIGQHLNEYLWERGIRNPPPRVTITVTRDADGIVKAELEGKEFAEAVRPQARTEEPQGLKEKLQATIGKKEAPADAPAEEAPKPVKKAPAKKAPKKDAEPKAE